MTTRTKRLLFAATVVAVACVFIVICRNAPNAAGPGAGDAPDGPAAPPRFRAAAYPLEGARFMIWGFDAMVPPGAEAELRGKVKSQIFGPLSHSPRGRTLEFLVPAAEVALRQPPEADWEAWKPVGEGRTDGEGFARARHVPATAPGEPPARVRILPVVVREASDPDRSRAAFHVFTFPADTPLVVVDIDWTISRTGTMDWLRNAGHDFEPVPGAVEGTRAIAERALVVYLTAREAMFTNETRLWLQRHGFPLGPLLLRDLGEDPLSASGFKRQTIARLKRDFPDIVAGIGERIKDARACAANGVPAFVIRDAAGEEDGFPCGPWPAAVRFVQERAESGTEGK